MTFILIAIAVIISAVCKAVMDVIDFHDDQSIFYNLGEWWRYDSWKSKWKNGIKSQGEAFPFSSTILVWTTNAWHSFQMIRTSVMLLLISHLTFYNHDYYLEEPQHIFKRFVGIFIISWILHSIVFHIFFTYIFVKKQK